MFLYPNINIVLILAAVLPATFLLWKVYKADKLESEPVGLLIKLVIFGIISTFIAILLETVGEGILDSVVSPYGIWYRIIEYFIVVGVSEEGAKYVLLKLGTWKDKEFNCQFDGIVYAVFVSLGFALFENIEYVFMYGLGTAALRAVTAIPGHASFGVFMGIFYGLAKRYAMNGQEGKAKTFRILAFIIPTLIHGTYDYIATMNGGDLFFIVFIIILFIIAYMEVNKFSKEDSYF